MRNFKSYISHVAEEHSLQEVTWLSPSQPKDFVQRAKSLIRGTGLFSKSQNSRYASLRNLLRGKEMIIYRGGSMSAMIGGYYGSSSSVTNWWLLCLEDIGEGKGLQIEVSEIASYGVFQVKKVQRMDLKPGSTLQKFYDSIKSSNNYIRFRVS
jgi:hypothetical protein